MSSSIRGFRANLGTRAASLNEWMQAAKDCRGLRLLLYNGRADISSTSAASNPTRVAEPQIGPTALPGVRIGELLEPLGWVGGKTIRDDYLCEIRPAVRAGQDAPTPERAFSKQAPDLLVGIRRCLWQLRGLPQTLVSDRQAAIHTFDGRPTREFAALCGQLKVDRDFCRPRDPQANGAVERCRAMRRRTSSPAGSSRTSAIPSPARCLVREGQRPDP
jgi:hypothetical protein